MNANVIASFKLMGMGMLAIFLVIIVIYISVNLMHKLTNKKYYIPKTTSKYEESLKKVYEKISSK